MNQSGASRDSVAQAPLTVGILHPGAMGAALARVAKWRGHDVLWTSAGRSSDSADRAAAAGATGVSTLTELVERADVVVSVCPPGAAAEVAEDVAAHGFAGTYIDANAITPRRAESISAVIESGGGTFVDASLIGPPPAPGRRTALYVCDPGVEIAGQIFSDQSVSVEPIAGPPGMASALKMCFGGYTKGLAALAAAIQSLSVAYGVEGALRREVALMLPGTEDTFDRALRSTAEKGWRWVAEMEGVAEGLDAVGLPEGIHRAAAQVFSAVPRGQDPTAVTPTALLHLLQAQSGESASLESSLAEIVSPVFAHMLRPGENYTLTVTWDTPSSLRNFPPERTLWVRVHVQGEEFVERLWSEDWGPSESPQDAAARVASSFQDWLAESGFAWGQLRDTPDESS